MAAAIETYGHKIEALARAKRGEMLAATSRMQRPPSSGQNGRRLRKFSAAVTAATLREFGAIAVEIHGQHDDRGLLNSKGHRALLDAFGRCDTSAVAAAWSEVTRIAAELGALRAANEAASRDRDYVAFAVAVVVTRAILDFPVGRDGD